MLLYISKCVKKQQVLSGITPAFSLVLQGTDTLMCTHRCDPDPQSVWQFPPPFSSPIPISDPFVTSFLSPVSSHYYPQYRVEYGVTAESVQYTKPNLACDGPLPPRSIDVVVIPSPLSSHRSAGVSKRTQNPPGLLCYPSRVLSQGEGPTILWYQRTQAPPLLILGSPATVLVFLFFSSSSFSLLIWPPFFSKFPLLYPQLSMFTLFLYFPPLAMYPGVYQDFTF